MTPDTLTTLQRAFSRLDEIHPDARNFTLDEKGLTFSYGRSVGYRGEYETEWEIISMTWEEFFEPCDFYRFCNARWQTVHDEREAAAEEKARQEREREKLLAPQRRRERELAELARLRALYPDA